MTQIKNWSKEKKQLWLVFVIVLTAGFILSSYNLKTGQGLTLNLKHYLYQLTYNISMTLFFFWLIERKSVFLLIVKKGGWKKFIFVIALILLTRFLTDYFVVETIVFQNQLSILIPIALLVVLFLLLFKGLCGKTK